jgi:hypothetical protein
MRPARHGRRDTGVHPAAQQNDRFGLPVHRDGDGLLSSVGCDSELRSLYAASGWMPYEFMQL